MKLIRTIVVTVVVVFLLSALLAAGTAFYAYRHPEVIGRVVEKTLSDALNADISVQRLAVDVTPLRLEAYGIQMQPQAAGEGVEGHISELRIEAAVEGPFGQRTLTVTAIEMTGWRLQAPFEFKAFNLLPGGKPPSLLSRTVGALVELFLFRHLRVDHLHAADGGMEIFSPDRRLTLSVSEAAVAGDGTMRLVGGGWFELPSQQIRFDAPDIRVSAGPKTSAGLALRSGVLTYGHLQAESVSLEGQMVWDREAQQVVIETGSLRIGHLTPTSGQRPQDALKDIALDVAGAIDLQKESISLRQWRLNVADGLQAAGQLQAGTSREAGIRIDITEGTAPAEQLMSLAARQADFAPPGLALSGPIRFNGTLHGTQPDTQWRWALEAQVRPDNTTAVVEAPSTTVRSRLTGVLSLSGVLPDIRLAARLNATDATIASPGIQPASFSAQLALNGTYPHFAVERLEVKVPQLAAAAEGLRVPIEDIRLLARNGRVNAARRSFDFGDCVLSTSRIKPIQLDLAGDANRQKLSLDGSQAGLVAIAETIGWIPAGWKIVSDEGLQAHLTAKDGGCEFDASLTLAKLNFEDPQQTAFGENIDMQAAIKGRLDFATQKGSLQANLRAPRGEILYGQFYFDLGQTPLDVAAAATFDGVAGEWELADVVLRLADIFDLRAGGRRRSVAGGHRLDLHLALPETDARPLLRHFIQEPFGVRAPALKTLRVDGALSVALDLRNDAAGPRITGRAVWSDGRLASDSLGIEVDGVTLDYPVWYQPVSPSGHSTPLTGRLRIAALNLPVLGRQTVNWPIQAGPDRIDIDAHTRIDFGDGLIEVGPIHLQNAYQPNRLLNTQVSVKSIATDQFLGRIWPHADMGSIAGRLNSVTYRDGRLNSKGRITADVFGGRVVVLNPSVAALFSPVPVFSADVLLEDINLADLTGGTDFGRIDGILGGSVKNLEIADGQPQQFDLLVETEKRDGVPQRISVKAVDSISQIGGGQTAFMGLAGSVLKLMPGFAYKKIGIRSSLQNDVFTVNGTTRESGTEYLVRRGGLAGVNVVNRDPNNRIRFKDMVKRVRRALASDSKPSVSVNQ